MRAHVGDHIIVRGNHVGDPNHDGTVLEIRGPDGTPPYRVRWNGTDHETLLFPGADALVEPAERSRAEP